MKTVIHLVLLSVFAFSSAWAAGGSGKAKVAEPKQTKLTLPMGNPVWGQEKADNERCIECHGTHGQGGQHPNSTEGKFAKLAGQYPSYILKQIREFRSGARKHDQMAIMARSVSDEDVIDIAAFFGSQKLMAGEGAGSELGKKLFDQGDATRGIPACASCHGANGKGLGLVPSAPIVGGQEWRYLDKQLRDWRSGDRRNSPDGVMNKVLSALTDKEIEALADHLAAQ